MYRILWQRGIFGLLLLLHCATLSAREPEWGLYAELLHEYVAPDAKSGIEANFVDYRRLRHDSRFQQLIEELATFNPEQLDGNNERKAFYLNAYNIFAIKIVIDNWPVRMVKSLGSLFNPVWNHHAGFIGGKSMTLSHLEHNVLRKMHDPRVHMALNCASLSCPDLRLEPYTGDKVEAQLDDQCRRFLHQPSKGAKVVGTYLHVSSIFKWFEADFDAVGGVRKFIVQYRPDLPSAIKIEADIDYDWTVNAHLSGRELREIRVEANF